MPRRGGGGLRHCVGVVGEMLVREGCSDKRKGRLAPSRVRARIE